MKKQKPLKKFPSFKPDEEAERFVEEADLSEYDFSQFKPVHFELRKKDKQINLRMPSDLLDAVKQRAEEEGIPYQRYIRGVLENALKAQVDA